MKNLNPINYFKKYFLTLEDQKTPYGLWITDIPLYEKLHGNSVYVNFLTKSLSNHLDLDLLFFYKEKYDENLNNRLKHFKNIYSLQQHENFGGAILDDGLRNNFNIISNKLIHWILDKKNYDKYDFVVCDYIYLSPILDFLPSNIYKIINTHDVYGNRHIKLKWNNEEQSKSFCITKTDEDFIIKKADLLLTISKDEELYFKERIGKNKKNTKTQCIKYIPHKSIKLNKPIDQNKKLILGFLGSSNPINREGVKELVNQLGILNNKDITLKLGGLVCNMIEADYDWLEKCFEVEERDIDDFYSSIDLMINPMPLNSTGLKIKTVECLINDIPIIGTQDAFTGIKTSSNWHSFKDIKDLVKQLEEIVTNDQQLDLIREDCLLVKNNLIKSSNDEIEVLANKIKKNSFKFKKNKKHEIADYKDMRYIKKIANYNDAIKINYSKFEKNLKNIAIRLEKRNTRLKQKDEYISKLLTNLKPNYRGFVDILETNGIYPDQWCQNDISINFRAVKKISIIDIDIFNPDSLNGEITITLNGDLHTSIISAKDSNIQIKSICEENSKNSLEINSSIDAFKDGDNRNLSYILKSISFITENA